MSIIFRKTFTTEINFLPGICFKFFLNKKNFQLIKVQIVFHSRRILEDKNSLLLILGKLELFPFVLFPTNLNLLWVNDCKSI